MSARVLAGVDVGGSKIAVLVAGPDRRVLAGHRVPTGAIDPSRAAAAIAEAVARALALAGCAPGDLAGIGVGIPGRVDPLAGTVTLAVNLGWDHVVLGPALADRFGVPVAVENDVRAAAAGIHARGLAGGASDLAYLGIGTGVSAGIVLGGHLHRGARGLAGEIGHVVRQPGGPRCACGLHGCLEAFASGRGVADRAADLAAVGRPVARTGVGPAAPVDVPSAADVYAAAAAGDPAAIAITTDAGRHLARAIHELVMTFDLERVFLGGGVTHAGPAFEAPLAAGLDELRRESELARLVLPDGLVTVLPPDADPAGWGAVVLAEGAARTASAAPAPVTRPARSGAAPAVGRR